jgi:predicted dehydrogenase
MGFLGVGWIGLNRLEAVARSGVAEIAALADPSREMTARAGTIAPRAAVKGSPEDLLALGLDGLVIATPNALHAEQALRALERGVAVFCQKPLARNASGTRSVIQAARGANRLLSVDLSYRFLSGARRIRELLGAGALGEIYAVEMLFHNAYGPDKAWFYNRKLSGGGCVVDLGIHLVDLALWALYAQRVR